MLLAATRAGDPEAFALFFRRHAQVVLGYVRRRVGSGEPAADLTCETADAQRRGVTSAVPCVAWESLLPCLA